MSGKAPAFQFYIKDWLSDTQLKMAEHSTKGIWIDMLCYMWEAPERGELQGTKKQLMQLVSATESDFDQFVNDAQQLCFCYVSVTDHGIITVRNRRMYREEKDKKNNRERQQRFRDKQKDNGEITHPSSSSSSSPTPNTLKKQPFDPPTKDDIENAAEPKTMRYLNDMCKRLVAENIFPEAYEWKLQQLNLHKNYKAMLHALNRLYMASKVKEVKNPWAYLKKTIAVENGNYNEAEYNKAEVSC